jgi:RNA polymerase sigma-70 factor, ECF subfamily
VKDDLVMGDPPNRQSPDTAPLDFRTLFELEISYVMRVLRRLGVPPADLEDMVHEVFLAVSSKLDTYDRSRPIRPWLFGFAFRIASHYNRKARREQPLDEPDLLESSVDAPDARLVADQKRALVLAALQFVEVERRGVFVMHDIDGFSCEEVARTFDIPIGTVYSRLRLARKDFEAAVRRLMARAEGR